MSDMTPEQRDAEQEKLKQDVLKRMKRIEGQIRGIQKMIEGGKECQDILVQVKAVTSALQSSTKVIMRRYLLRCVTQAENGGKDEVAELEKFITVVANYLH